MVARIQVNPHTRGNRMGKRRNFSNGHGRTDTGY
jgi:hypothetical protein